MISLNRLSITIHLLMQVLSVQRAYLERIQEVIRQLNGIRHVRGPALDAFGIGDPQGNEYNGINDTDVSIVVGHLRDAFKLDGTNDAGKLCAKKSNFFKTNDPEWKGLPWTRIAKFSNYHNISNSIC